MTKALHILNGDSSRYLIEKSGLKGDYLVWREMLCEGPLEKEVGNDQFWKTRYQFYQETLKVDKLDYYDRVIKELVLIEDLSSYDEVVLWFEYDLFCQVNLLAACSYLLRYYKKDILYYLICVGEQKESDEMVSLGHFTPQEFPQLYTSKVKLSRSDLLFADTSWKLFAQGAKEQLETFDFSKKKKFKYLKRAIDQHLENSNRRAGLTGLERHILSCIQKEGQNKTKLIRNLLNWQRTATVNGFGDLQYQLYLDKLEPYYNINDEIYTLNQKGLDALK